MAFTFGFYNSLNKDRRYNAIQISMIFDGIIRDGIYASLGEQMIVKASTEDDTVIVAPGRGWFDHTWNYNDADMLLTAEQSELLLDRWDAVVIDINSNENHRLNQVKWIKGTPSSSPVKPTMEKTLEHKQYPLAYIYRKANTTKINQEDIENRVGTSECPFVTGILDQVSIDDLLLQWKDQWARFIVQYEQGAEEWMQNQQTEFNTWQQTEKDDFESWQQTEKTEFNTWQQTEKTEFNTWMQTEKDDFSTFYTEFKNQLNEFEQASGQEFSDWFAGIKDILDENSAGHLQNEIEEIQNEVFNNYYGLVWGLTEINNKTGIIKTTSADGISTTTFKDTADGKVITTTISLNSGNFDYVKTTTIVNTDNGKQIETNYIRRPK